MHLNINLIFEKNFVVELDDGHLNEEQLKEARLKRTREKNFWKLIKQLIAYLIFITALIIFSYSNRDPNLFKYKDQLDKYFITNTYEKVNFFRKLYFFIIS